MKFNVFSLDRVPLIGLEPVVTLDQPSQGISTPVWHLIQVSITSLAWVLLTGCPPDNAPLIEEKEQLKKQIVKQESMMTTLQEGNRVLQEQINRLNQELRENENEFAKQLELSQQTSQGLSTEKQNLLQQVTALTQKNRKLKLNGQKLKGDAQQMRKRLELLQQTGQDLSSEKQNLLQRITALTQENRKLQLESQKHKSDAQWLRKQREIFRQSLQANNQTVKVQKLPHKFPDVTKATLQALAQNGYTLMAKMETDQKVVFITERKASLSPSIELPGYRNQYLVELEVQPKNQTALKVKAQYEKMAQGGKIIEVGDKEVTEIERRLIQAIQQVLNRPKKEKAKPKELKKQPVPPSESP